MDYLLPLFGWVGIYAPLGFSAVGSILGCTRAGQAACGAMLESDSGYARYVAASAMPSSQTIYGLVLQLLLLVKGVGNNNAMALFALGVLSGIVLMMSAIFQGICCASAIRASKTKPQVFGLAIAPAAIVEGFAIFAFVAALVTAGNIDAAQAVANNLATTSAS